MTIDSVGVSNTSGYSFTGGDPTSTGGIVGLGNGISSYTPMTGGGRKKKNKKKTKMRRSISKRVRAMTRKKIRSVKSSIKKTRKRHYHKRRMKHRKAREDIIKSVEAGLPISKKSTKKLSPSMQSFLDGIESKTKSGSVIKFSDFKSDPIKVKSKSKSRSKSKKKGLTRGGNSMKGGVRNCKLCSHYHKGGCQGSGCKRKKKTKKKSFFSWF